MDCSSINMLDLQFLTNPLELQKLNKKQEISLINEQDKAFYKKRIFQMAKDILLNQSVDVKLKHSFEVFCCNCIEYFKFIDKSEIIQKDYIDVPQKKIKVKKYLNLDTTNQIIMKKKHVRSPKITDHIKIKRKNKKKTIIPKKRIINLKDPQLMFKGVECKK